MLSYIPNVILILCFPSHINVMVLFGVPDGSAEKRAHPVGLMHTIRGLRKDTLYGVHIIPEHEQGFEGLPSPPLNVSTCASE